MGSAPARATAYNRPPMSRLLRVSLALGAVFFATMLAACGSSVPSGAVLSADNVTVSKSTFTRWLTASAKSGSGQGGGALPDAPNFTQCTAATKAAAPKPAKGAPPTNDLQYKQQCQSRYAQLREQTANFLISTTWLDLEAKRENVSVSDDEVKKAFEKVRIAAFPKAKDFVSFMKSSGVQQADLLFRQRSQLLQEKITTKINKGVKKPTDADLLAFYNKNKSQFGSPESRTLEVILNVDKKKAEAGKQAVQSGTKWAVATKKFSSDTTTTASGGVLRDVQRGQGEKAFDDAVFAAKQGEIVGPINTSSGYYVFRVTAIKKANFQPFAKLKPQILTTVTQKNNQDALVKFGKDYQKRWKAKTECSHDALVANCHNFKVKKILPTVPSTATTPAAPIQTSPTPTTTTSK